MSLVYLPFILGLLGAGLPYVLVVLPWMQRRGWGVTRRTQQVCWIRLGLGGVLLLGSIAVPVLLLLLPGALVPIELGPMVVRAGRDRRPGRLLVLLWGLGGTLVAALILQLEVLDSV